MSQSTEFENMPLLKEAMALLEKPVTLESVQQWELLMAKARGAEAEHVGQVYEGLLAAMESTELLRLEDWLIAQHSEDV